ncbi:MAG: VCBS repeat-containing protein [Verrucomicrobia bacterium]|nr:VCBS repeat-containing protein [Verrucomicrobiota bacterium]MCG2679414.1 VCBS repeat-containing protein [Kiritimatiellia bacterium]MBU4247600.1 VCBS repeat-containing protein [Verrucomicrobiota bacterium]MBU4289857.1 VCBS repeat-containing protein [Verrucomicrobiota bacterium]MBU4428777.1 VCBS repeat-containing protein [Verrucomicrobiota bacterium]
MNFLRIGLAAVIIGLAWPGLAETTYSIGVLYNLGGLGYTPLKGDYDGDGKTDPAVYQDATGNWYVGLSSNDYRISVINLGGSDYMPVEGDYDGDGKADPAVYEEITGSWYARLSGSQYEISWMPDFGERGYLPMPGDYDGNGETEMAVYQMSSGNWYLLSNDPDEISDLDLLAVMYSNAMVNAANVTASKIRRDLTPITEDTAGLIWRTNPDTGVREVLVMSFMKEATASNYYHAGQYTSLQYGDSWVTLVPDLQTICRNFTGTNLCLRLKQVLGLPATSLNDTIVEYYVNPLNLLRPARDPEITDREAEVAFRANLPYASMVSTNYQGWFQRTIDSRNYGMTNGVWNAWPWTQLGYTYDWSKTGNNVMGLSEFVIPAEMLYNEYSVTTLVYVVTVTGAVDYATAPDNRAIPPQGYTINVAPPEDR